jgi:hypothetical protein
MLVANDDVLISEWRLRPAVVGGIFSPMGIFWWVLSRFTLIALLNLGLGSGRNSGIKRRDYRWKIFKGISAVQAILQGFLAKIPPVRQGISPKRCATRIPSLYVAVSVD